MPDDWHEGNEDWDSLYEEFYAGVTNDDYSQMELEARLDSIGDPEGWDTNPTFFISEEGEFSVQIEGEMFYLGDNQDSFAAIWEWCQDHDIDIEDIIYG